MCIKWFFYRCFLCALACFTPCFIYAAEEDGALGQTVETVQRPVDEEAIDISNMINQLSWCPSENPDKAELCELIEQLESLESESQENINKLRENAQAMKDKEQSLENRILGATGMATVGIGGMMAASAYAEQQADQDAEQAMRAYLATFTCNYGDQKNIRGGEKNIELPGANELVNLHTEYKTLVASLKERKLALDLSPGIESETILDKADTNLYDDIGTGITSGAFTSVSRAVLNPNGTDAAQLAQQSEKSAQNLKTGLITAGAGAVATIAANYAINHDNKNQSDELLVARQELKTKYKTVADKIIDECNKNIQFHKDFVDSGADLDKNNDEIEEYVKAVKAAKPITNISEILTSPFCR